MYRILVVALVLMAASVFAVNRMGKTTAAVASAEQTSALGPRIVAIDSDSGHFTTEASVEGREMTFIVDTGATQVALRASEAARLGYSPDPSDYTIRLETANGEGHAAPIELRTVQVGSIMLRDVTALVVPDDALGVNLLGMSFLSRVRWTQQHGQLVLQQQ